MSSFLLTGCARGLGLALVKELASRPRSQVSLVIATTRSQEPGKDLSQVIDSSGGLIHHAQIDITDLPSVKDGAQTVASILGDGNGLDYLINNAAMREPNWQPKLEDMTHLRECLDLNVIGTHEAIATFLPLLRKGNGKKIVLVSSTLGCITTQQTDPKIRDVHFPAYKVSKAGTHMLTALWSNYLAGEGFCVYMQSPGNLKTELAGGDAADLDPAVGAKELIRIALEAGPQDTGRHRNIRVEEWGNRLGKGGRYDGKDLEW